MAVIQRVRVRWGAGSRGAVHANVRRHIPGVLAFPSVPEGLGVVHDVLADEAAGYEPATRLLAGLDHAREVGLWIELDAGAVGRSAARTRRVPGQA